MKKELRTEIIIEAPRKNVWNVLIDFARYEEWNPFIYPIKGEAVEGTRLKNTMHLPGGKPQVFKPKITELIPQEKLIWLGSLFIRGLFDGEHYFILKDTSEGFTHLIHGENFSGILVKTVMNSIEDKTLQGFMLMNEALKERVETQLTEGSTTL